jgi:hypothetical protein
MRTERAARCAGEAERTTSFKKIERAVVFSGETKSPTSF